MVSWVLCSWLPDDDQVWIDEPVSDKHRTALMIAAKKNRLQCLTALVEEFGARVNYQVRYFPPPPPSLHMRTLVDALAVGTTTLPQRA